jgi:hypothetical protein
MKKALVYLGVILSCIVAQGSFRKTVVVKSNAANAPTSVLRIKGFVREKKVQRSQKRRS